MNRSSVILLLATLLCVGCGGPKAYVRKGFLDHPPRRVAVLPFVITYAYDVSAGEPIPASHQLGRDIFRKTFYYGLTPYGYEDVKPSDVDDRLTNRWGPMEEGRWRAARPQELAEVLGVDALIYGDVERIMSFATPVYTETSLTATLRMVDAASGEDLWRQRVRASERGGALVQKGQVVDFVQDQARSYKPDVKFLRVADVVVRQALKGMPNPPMRAEAQAGPGWGAAKSDARVVRLAVLPFGAKRQAWWKAGESLRKSLSADLQESPFELLELQRVNTALMALGWKEGEPLPEDLPIPKLAEALGADVVLRGTVTNWGRSYLVVESWVKAELQLELVDAKSGDVIWSQKKKNTRTAGILKGPTGYKSIATAPLSGLKTSHLERVAGELTRKLAEELSTSPAVVTYVSEMH